MPDLNAYTLTRAGASVIGSFGPPPAWADESACAQVDPELFFQADHERPGARREREAAAKAVCATCPVRAECLSYAVDTRQRDGVWGGKTEREREPLLRFRTLNGATR